MVAIIVVCVGFLLFMIVLGVLRIRAAHNRTRVLQVDEKEEMEWDNSELNITVNPIDQEVEVNVVMIRPEFFYLLFYSFFCNKLGSEDEIKIKIKFIRTIF